MDLWGMLGVRAAETGTREGVLGAGRALGLTLVRTTPSLPRAPPNEIVCLPLAEFQSFMYSVTDFLSELPSTTRRSGFT